MLMCQRASCAGRECHSLHIRNAANVKSSAFGPNERGPWSNQMSKHTSLRGVPILNNRPVYVRQRKTEVSFLACALRTPTKYGDREGGPGGAGRGVIIC